MRGRQWACCFTGHRPGKLPWRYDEEDPRCLALKRRIADAVEAATLTPAKAFGFDRANPVTKQPLGLLAPGYAADVLLLDPATWSVTHVWCDARPLR